MELTLNILLDDLAYCNPVCYIKNRSRTFKGVRLLSPDILEKDPDRLIVTRLSMALANPMYTEDCCVAAVIDTALPKDSSVLRNMVLFDTEMNAVDFFMIVQGIFEKYFEWCNNMDQCLIKHGSIQDILDLTEPVIGNYITISDSAFSLVAYTQNLSCDDPITNGLVQRGYHDQEAINVFARNNLMDFWRDAVDIYVRPADSITGYPILAKVIHYNNSYYSHVVMLCTKRLPGPGLKDLFKMLIDRLMVCFERQWIENNQMPHVYDSLLLEMLEPNDLTLETINARAKNAGIPVKGNFRLIKVSTDDSTGIMLQRLCQELSTKLPQSRVTLSKDILVALIPMKNVSGIDQLLESLQDVMEKYHSCCGMSDPFTTLSDIRLAGEQAEIALACTSAGTKQQFAIGGHNSFSRVRTFGSCYPRFVIAGKPETAHIARNSMASKALDTLCEYDSKHGTNNLELLFVYLTNERRASDTAQIMHMHRNNVIYRIGKISEMIGMDLGESGTRFRLLMAYEIYTPKEQ